MKLRYTQITNSNPLALLRRFKRYLSCSLLQSLVLLNLFPQLTKGNRWANYISKINRKVLLNFLSGSQQGCRKQSLMLTQPLQTLVRWWPSMVMHLLVMQLLNWFAPHKHLDSCAYATQQSPLPLNIRCMWIMVLLRTFNICNRKGSLCKARFVLLVMAITSVASKPCLVYRSLYHLLIRI